MYFQRKQSEWLFARLREVMMEECYQYKKNKHLQTAIDCDTRQWERFIDVAQSKIKISKQCLTPLAKTAECWGINKVQYYEWASMGWKYCNVLSAAASRTPVWEEARVKLNQLLLRRIVEGRSLRMTANPIYLLDLEYLLAWPGKTNLEKRGRSPCILKYELLTEADLPDGYTFDQFGLIMAELPKLALPACPTMEPRSPKYLNTSEDEATSETTSLNHYSKLYSQSWQLLQLATLMWCFFLAALSWWYRLK